MAMDNRQAEYKVQEYIEELGNIGARDNSMELDNIVGIFRVADVADAGTVVVVVDAPVSDGSLYDPLFCGYRIVLVVGLWLLYQTFSFRFEFFLYYFRQYRKKYTFLGDELADLHCNLYYFN